MYPKYEDYQASKMIEVMGDKKFKDFAVMMLDCEVQKIINSIQHPNYSHSRAGVNGYGSPNGLTHIYHSDEKSPTGVMHHMSSETVLVEYLLRLFKNNSPLSPTEGR